MTYEFLVIIILVSLNCADEDNINELGGLIEIADTYLWSFGFSTEIHSYCVTPTYDLKQFEYGNASIVMFDYELWGDQSYEKFGYEPPAKGTQKINGEIFLDDMRVLMSFSLADDFNSQILTHELLHFVMWDKGFPEDVYMDQIHEDWKKYKLDYQHREKLFSEYAKKYYYIFG